MKAQQLFYGLAVFGWDIGMADDVVHDQKTSFQSLDDVLEPFFFVRQRQQQYDSIITGYSKIYQKPEKKYVKNGKNIQKYLNFIASHYMIRIGRNWIY